MGGDAKILDKIKKLLALGTSNNEHEAAAALAMAQKLMAEHGVTTSELKLADVTHVDVLSPFSISKINDYEGQLAKTIAKLFSCDYCFMAVTTRSIKFGLRKGAEWRFIGRADSVELAKYSFVVMARKLKRARAEYVAKHAESGYNRQTLNAIGNGFCDGWVKGVIKPLQVFALKPEDQSLFLAYADTKLHMKITTADVQRKPADLMSTLAGFAAGSDESLQRPMNGGQQTGALTHG